MSQETSSGNAREFRYFNSEGRPVAQRFSHWQGQRPAQADPSTIFYNVNGRMVAADRMTPSNISYHMETANLFEAGRLEERYLRNPTPPSVLAGSGSIHAPPGVPTGGSSTGLAFTVDTGSRAPHVRDVRMTTPGVPRRGPGIVPTVALAAVSGIAAMAQGASPALAAEAAITTVAESAAPGISDGFQGVRTGSIANRIFNGIDTATGVVVTTATLASAAPGAQPITIPAAAVAGTANLINSAARSAARALGADVDPGLVDHVIQSVQDRNRRVDLFNSMDASIRAGASTPEMVHLSELRGEREHVRDQMSALQRYSPGARGPDAGRRPPPLSLADGRTLTNYRDIHEELTRRYTAAHGRYFDSAIQFAAEHPSQVGQVVQQREAIERQAGANFQAVTASRFDTERALPAVIAQATPEQPNPSVRAPAPSPSRAPGLGPSSG